MGLILKPERRNHGKVRIEACRWHDEHRGLRPVAIFSLNHSTVGRKTHAPRTAGYHVRYITRPQAATRVLGERMPLDPFAARAWMDAEEQKDRVNARVVDKLIVALPLELTHEQRAELVQMFAAAMTEGRASWMAALHDGPGDMDNPHAHILFRDRDVVTGKRVMSLSEKGSTERLRIAWEEKTNDALKRAGREERVDRRTLEAQGIDREAGIHVGQAAQVLDASGKRPQSKPRDVVHLIKGERVVIAVDYPAIDAGRTRMEENEERRHRNGVRDRSRSQDELEWTNRAGMVAQQRSAIDWARASNDNPGATAPRVAPGAGSETLSRELKLERSEGSGQREKTDRIARQPDRPLPKAVRDRLEELGPDHDDRGNDRGR